MGKPVVGEVADAYRRDRRNDALLQQQGYFVLRFLAEDAGRRLDDVLDAILAALAHLLPKESVKPTQGCHHIKPGR